MLFKKFWKLYLKWDPRKEKALGGIHSSEEFTRILRRERERADRNGRQFSLLSFEVNHKDRTSRGLIALAEALSRRMRLTDEVGWLDGRIGIFLPETPAQGACKLADDICRMVEASDPAPKYNLYLYPLEPSKERDRGAQEKEGGEKLDVSKSRLAASIR